MNSDGCSLPDFINATEIIPCGMMIEPYGEHSFAELKEYYKEQCQKNENASSFMLKNMTLMSDLRAGLLSCKKTGKAVYAVLNVDEEQRTTGELPADSALITLQSMGLSAFGIEAESEDTIVDGITRLVRFSEIPLFAKVSEKSISELKENGLIVIEKDGYAFFDISEDEKEKAFKLANERQAFFLEPDTTEISEAIPCEANMDEILCEASQEAFDILKIEINSPDDALAFIQDAHMADLPVMFSCEDDISIMLALMLYQGRALIDSTCELDEKTLTKAVTKYGAVIY